VSDCFGPPCNHYLLPVSVESRVLTNTLDRVLEPNKSSIRTEISAYSLQCLRHGRVSWFICKSESHFWQRSSCKSS